VFTGILYVNLKEKDHLEDLDWTDVTRDTDRWRALSKCGNELSGSIKCGEFID
jgi:hypothetical protein